MNKQRLQQTSTMKKLVYMIKYQLHSRHDIHDLSLHELSLTLNKSWLIRRSRLSKKNMRLLADIDSADVQNSVNYLKSQNWFLTIQQDPNAVTTVMYTCCVHIYLLIILSSFSINGDFYFPPTSYLRLKKSLCPL